MIILYGFLYRNFCDYCDKCNKMNIKIDLNELYDITWGYFGDIFVWFPDGGSYYKNI
jgi:hypothetical protein